MGVAWTAAALAPFPLASSRPIRPHPALLPVRPLRDRLRPDAEMAAVAASAVGESGAERETNGLNGAGAGLDPTPLQAVTIQAALRAFADKVKAEQALVTKGAKLPHVYHLESPEFTASRVLDQVHVLQCFSEHTNGRFLSPPLAQAPSPLL